MPTRFTSNDFFSGLFAALKTRNRTSLSIRDKRFDEAVERVFRRLGDEAAGLDLDITFRIKLNPQHGDSEAVRQGIAAAAQRDLITQDNPEYQIIRIKISQEGADRILDRLPGGRQLYLGLADQLLETYGLAPVA